MEQLRVETPELAWEWDGKAHVLLDNRPMGGYGVHQTVDPTPGYSHDPALVRVELERVAATFPVPWPITVYVLSHDYLDRTNGQTIVETVYRSRDEAPVPHTHFARITLAGKRIPLHPAMTRYLVAHEYGHVVERWVAASRGLKVEGRELLEEYGRIRPGTHEGARPGR